MKLRSILAVLVACATFQVGTAQAQSPIGQPGVTELLRTTHGSMQVYANRNNQIATGLDFGSYVGQVVYYDPVGGLSQTAVPTQDRFLGLNLSNWGVSVLGVTAGGPFNTYTAPFGQSLTQVFAGNSGGTTSLAAINDAGQLGFVSRVNTGFFKSVYRAEPGSPPQQAPSFGDFNLSQFALIDNAGRVAVIAEQHSPTYDGDLYRYDSSTGWQNLTSGFSEFVVSSLGSNAMNAAGDTTFISYDPTGGGQYYLNVYRTATESIDRISEVSYESQFGPQLRQVLANIDDAGAMLAEIGGANFSDAQATMLLSTPGGTLIDLGQLLPANEHIPSYPFSDDFTLTPGGQALFNSRNDLTGLWTYYHYDYSRSRLFTIPQLSNLLRPLDQSVLTDDGRVYFWMEDGSENVLGVLAVPEPSTLGLLALGGVAVVAARRRRRLHWG